MKQFRPFRKFLQAEDAAGHYRHDGSAFHGMVVAISSPYRRGGLLQTKHKEFFCVDDPDVLVIQAASRTMNPTLDEQEIAKAFADDPSAARAESGGEFRDDISGFVDADIVSRIRLSDKTSRLRPRPVAAKRG